MLRLRKVTSTSIVLVLSAVFVSMALAHEKGDVDHSICPCVDELGRALDESSCGDKGSASVAAVGVRQGDPPLLPGYRRFIKYMEVGSGQWHVSRPENHFRWYLKSWSWVEETCGGTSGTLGEHIFGSGDGSCRIPGGTMHLARAYFSWDAKVVTERDGGGPEMRRVVLNDHLMNITNLEYHGSGRHCHGGPGFYGYCAKHASTGTSSAWVGTSCHPMGRATYRAVINAPGSGLHDAVGMGIGYAARHDRRETPGLHIGIILRGVIAGISIDSHTGNYAGGVAWSATMGLGRDGKPIAAHFSRVGEVAQEGELVTYIDDSNPDVVDAPYEQTFQNSASGMCLDAEDPRHDFAPLAVDGTRVQLYSCYPVPGRLPINQYWWFEDEGDGYFTIRVRNLADVASKCLTIVASADDPPGDIREGATAEIRTCGDIADVRYQRFRFERYLPPLSPDRPDTYDNRYWIRVQRGDKCLQGGIGDGANVEVRRCNGFEPEQRWYFRSFGWRD